MSSLPPPTERTQKPAWRREGQTPSLPESYRTIPIAHHWPTWRKLLSFSGPGYLVAVGYMDPGNWATDLAGGSQFGYALLCVVMMSSIMAMILQALSAKLGIATGRDLAQACRDHFSRPVSFILWVLCEIAICACDLAEVIGTAIALNLLFQLPLLLGVCLTALDVLVVLYFQHLGFRYIEALVLALTMIIGICFGMQIYYSQPDAGSIMRGLMPTSELLLNPEMLYLGIGILGATVMPHNLYLHSSIVQTRKYGDEHAAKREAIRLTTIDSTVALTFAFMVNAAILIVSATVFHENGYGEVAEIQDAYYLLSPTLGVPLASTLFALALLLAGQNSTLTGTLAGQIVMEGFLDIRLRPWLRRLITRGIAIIPAVICVILFGEKGVSRLLIFSQVVLSFQLAFAVIPLVLFTSCPRKMGEYVNSRLTTLCAGLCAVIIVVLNLKYLIDFAF